MYISFYYEEEKEIVGYVEDDSGHLLAYTGLYIGPRTDDEPAWLTSFSSEGLLKEATANVSTNMSMVMLF
jgi:hypothetical protein